MAAAVIKKRFTADEYQRMGQVGILSSEDRVELIDGEVVTMTPIGARHVRCVNHATRALVRAAGDDAIVQAQSRCLIRMPNRSRTWSSCGHGWTSTPLVFQVQTTFFSSSRSPTPRSSTTGT